MSIQVEVVVGNIGELEWDALLVGVYADAPELDEWATAADALTNGYLRRMIKEEPDSAKWGELTVVPVWPSSRYQKIILLGLGKAAELSGEKLRFAAGSAMRAAAKNRARVVASLLHRQCSATAADLCAAARYSVEGALLGAYRFDVYKTTATAAVKSEKLLLIEGDTTMKAALAQTSQESMIVADSVNLSRDLVNHPAGYMTPSRLVAEAERIATESGMALTVLEREQMAELKMGALLAVAQGSVVPPKMIVLKYQGGPEDQPWTAFVGKGITFDSGGISLKPSENMGEMKDDMAGAAAVLGAMAAVGRLGVKRNILAVMPCTENMPAGNAYHPGDVLTSMDGKTIEVISTDAEGRLILADALTYAKQLGAVRIVDVATLTGACVIALGKVISGVIGNDKDWVAQVLAAATAAGEKMWEMPNDDEFQEQIKSGIADLKNTGGRPGGMITGGLFIGQFAGATPWVHIDIAGTADADKEQGYRVKGATGVGVRTLLRLAQDCRD